MIIAADRRQARVIMRYCLGLLKSVPMLAQLIESETRESVTLRNRIVIEVHTASSSRSTRGYTIVCALLDEIAYFPTDEASAEPDVEIINAMQPGHGHHPSVRFFCAHHHRMLARVLFGPRSPSTSARTAIRCWCGRQRPAT